MMGEWGLQIRDGGAGFYRYMMEGVGVYRHVMGEWGSVGFTGT